MQPSERDIDGIKGWMQISGLKSKTSTEVPQLVIAPDCKKPFSCIVYGKNGLRVSCCDDIMGLVHFINHNNFQSQNGG